MLLITPKQQTNTFSFFYNILFAAYITLCGGCGNSIGTRHMHLLYTYTVLFNKINPFPRLKFHIIFLRILPTFYHHLCHFRFFNLLLKMYRSLEKGYNLKIVVKLSRKYNLYEIDNIKRHRIKYVSIAYILSKYP